MTIDERLEKLAERHEALAQTVELLAADVRQLALQQQQMVAQQQQMVAQQQQMAAENRERDQRMGKMLEQIMEGMGRLLHIAEIHEQRITRLEGGES